MNRNWLAALILVAGLKSDAQGGQFIFQVVPTNVVAKFNPTNLTYSAVATSGTNFICVGSNSLASLAGTSGAPPSGGYLLTNSLANSSAWTNQKAPGIYYLNAIAYGAGAYVAGGFSNATFAYASGAWSGPKKAIVGNNVDAEGIGFNPASGDFSLVTASYQAAWEAGAAATSWSNAVANNAAVVESFRGVTSLGGSNMALCGINGDIRTSTNGGQSWNVVSGQQFNFTAPNLNAIASDGNSNLVCVGDANTVLVSTNGGSSWLSNSVAGSTATNSFAAVAYTGPSDNQFVLADKNGHIYMAANSNSAVLAWKQATNFLPALPGNSVSNSLLGATVATTGPLQGVAMLVGANGTIVIGGTPPTLPINLGNKTNCATFDGPFTPANSNPTLYVSVTPDNLHPSNSVSVDWFFGATNGPSVATDTLMFTPTNNQPFNANTPSNYVYYVRARDLRTGLVSLFTNITLTINPRPMASMPGYTATNCDVGIPFTNTNTVTGLGPWAVIWNDGTAQLVTNVGPGPVTFYRTVYPTNSFGANQASNNVYYITGVSNADTCVGNLPGDILGTNDIMVNPRPTAMLLSFNTTNCNEGPVYTLTNTLTGIGPWVVTWNDGYVQSNTTVGAGPVTLNRLVQPTNSFGANMASNNIYYVVAVTDGTGCAGSEAPDIQGVVTNTINPRPTAMLLSFNTTDCNEGPVYTLTNTLTGIGPWVVTWNDGYVQSNTTMGAGPVTLNRLVQPTNSFAANVASNNVYFVIAVTDGTACAGDQSGDILGTVTNTINPRPTASLLSFNTTNCNEGPVYTLTNTLTGIGPWVVTWNDGYVQTNAAAGAGPVTLNRSVQPTNSFAANAASNNVYYVVAVKDGTACVGDQSRDITGTVTNTITPRPTAALLSFNTTDCNEGPVYTLTNTLTGIGPWVVTWNDGYVQTNTTAGAGPVTLNRLVQPTNSFGANLASNNVFYVVAVTDGTACAGDEAPDIMGAVTNMITPRPTASLLSFNTTDCNEGPVYTLTNTLTGIGPWVVTWNDGYVQTSAIAGAGPVTLNRLVQPTNYWANLASNNVYYVVAVTDGTGCNGDEAPDIMGAVTNTINPRPTAMLLSFNTTNCNEGPVYTLTNTLTGIGPWVVTWNDGYVQSNTTVGAGPVTLNRLVQPTNSFGANLASNNVFYVVAVTDGTACAGDETPDIMGAVTNTITPRPTASLLSFNTTDCNEGPVYTLTNTLTGVGPWVVTWNDGYVQTNTTAGAGPVTLNRLVQPTNSFGANLASNNVYYVIAVTDGTACAGDQPADILGVVTNTINPRPTAALLSFNTTDCNAGPLYTLTNTLTGIGPWVVTWNDGYVQSNTTAGAGPVTLNRLVQPTNYLANVSSNNVYYVVAVTDGTMCNGDQAPDILGVVTNTVNPRPTSMSVTTNVICNGSLTVLTNVLTGLGPWTVNWTDGVTNFTQTVNVSAAGPYTNTLLIPTNGVFYPTNVFANQPATNLYWVATLSDSHCEAQPADIGGTNLILVNPRPTSMSVTTNVICNGSSTILTNVLTGLGPWTVYWTDGVTNFTQMVAVPAAGPYTNTLQIPNGVFNPTNPIANQAVTNLYWVAMLTDSNCVAQQADLNGVNLVQVNPTPLPPFEPQGLPGIHTDEAGDIFETNVLGSALSLSVMLRPNTTVSWFDGTQTNLLTNSTAVYLPTNVVCGYYTNYLEVEDTVTGCVGPNLTKVILVLVPPAPVSNGDQANCAGVVNPPLSVTVLTNSDNPANLTANWYTMQGIPVTNHSLIYLPTDTTPGTNTYWVETQDSVSTLVSTNRIPVSLILLPCTNPPTIMYVSTNGVGTIQWFGDLTLQSTTNLAPANWQDVSNGLMGTNTLIWTNGVPPWTNFNYFFRLNTN